MFNPVVGISQRACHFNNRLHIKIHGSSNVRYRSSLTNLRQYRKISGRNSTFPQTNSVFITNASSFANDVSDSNYGIQYLYQLYFCACLMERTWRFALPLILANLEGGYKAVAILCFVSPLACSLFAPRVGRLLDSVDRAVGVASLLGLQCFSIIASGLILLIAFHFSISILVAPIFHILLLLSMMEKLAAVTSEVAIERDWVTQLCGKENNLALANSNSMLRRMDLACDFVGTVSFGWMYDAAGPLGSVVYTTLIAVVSTPILYNLVYKINSIAPDSMKRKKTFQKTARQSRQGSWRAYFRQPILPSSLVFVLLFFNVALSPGGILTAFLTSQGMNGSSLAIFRGSCAIMGFVGSWCGKFLIKNFGLMLSGRYALLMLLASLGTSLAIYLFSNLSSAWPLIIFTGGIVFSRIGLWSFDMVNAQLFQQNVDESETAGTASTEMALCSFSEIFMLGVGASLSVPLESFYSVLVSGSFAAILLGTFVYFSWSARVLDRRGVILISH